MSKEIAVTFQVDGQEVKLTPSIVQNYLIGSEAQITLPEFKFFTELCKVRGLNPFLKEAYLIKYGKEPAQMVVGKDAIQKRAIRHPQYDGMESGIIVQTESGEVQERKGLFYLPGEQVVGGWASVYRKDWNRPTYVSVSVGESIQLKKDGTPNTMWRTKKATMIEKVAKVRALRESFVEELAGMYEEEEMGAILPDVVVEPESQIVEVSESDNPWEDENVIRMEDLE